MLILSKYCAIFKYGLSFVNIRSIISNRWVTYCYIYIWLNKSIWASVIYTIFSLMFETRNYLFAWKDEDVCGLPLGLHIYVFQLKSRHKHMIMNALVWYFTCSMNLDSDRILYEVRVLVLSLLSNQGYEY